MDLRILLCDIDLSFASLVKEELEQFGFDVDQVFLGKDVQARVHKKDYFAVIINYDVKEHSGDQVLKFINNNLDDQKIILLLENETEAYLLEEGAYKKLFFKGVWKILVKPIKAGDIKNELERFKNFYEIKSSLKEPESNSAESLDESDESFSRIKIDNFYTAKAAFFDVYIKLNENKYLKILHAGEKFAKDRLDKYKNEKSLEYFYVHQKDRLRVIEYNNHVSKKLSESDSVALKSKNKILLNSAELYLDEIFTVGIEPKVIEQGKEICSQMYNIVKKHGDLYKLLQSYHEIDPTAFSHSYMTALYSSAMIKKFPWQSKVIIETTALASFYHDIGKMNFDERLLNLRPREMSEVDKDLYDQHPLESVKVLAPFPQISNSVKNIIMQHHEVVDGTGFPNGLKDKGVFFLANILCLADDFTHLMIEEELRPLEALSKFTSDPQMIKRYHKEIMESFMSIFKK